MSFTLLLTCVGGELAPQMIRFLKGSTRHDVTVVGVDAREDAAGRHFADHFATVPTGDSDEYVEAIAQLVSQHSVDMVLPTSDEEALALASQRERIEDVGTLLACSSSDVLNTISNKASAYRRFAELGLRTPEWVEAHTLTDIAAAATDIFGRKGEVVVKPSDARGGRGVCVIRSDVSGSQALSGGRELHMDLSSFENDYLCGFSDSLPAMVMERLVDPVFDVDMLAWKGDPIRVVARRRVHSAQPNEGHTIVANHDLVELGEKLIRSLNLSWLYDCDVMYDGNDQLGVLEINPRPSGSIATTIAAGVPLLDDLISLAKGEDPPKVNIPVGQVVVPFKSLAPLGP